jgi:hypothetical protein
VSAAYVHQLRFFGSSWSLDYQESMCSAYRCPGRSVIVCWFSAVDLKLSHGVRNWSERRIREMTSAPALNSICLMHIAVRPSTVPSSHMGTSCEHVHRTRTIESSNQQSRRRGFWSIPLSGPHYLLQAQAQAKAWLGLQAVPQALKLMSKCGN